MQTDVTMQAMYFTIFDWNASVDGGICVFLLIGES